MNPLPLPVEMFESPATAGGTLPAVSMAEIEAALAGSANADTVDPLAKPIYMFSQRELDHLIDTAKAQERHTLLTLADPERQVWMQTRYGRKFFALDPRPEEVFIDDVAAALSKLCRYGGHCKWFYSVAEHSVHVSNVVPPEHALAALLHDATEAYLVDMPRPIKRQLWAYGAIEDRLWRAAIAPRFNLPIDLPECVKEADNAVLLAERDQIMEATGEQWSVPGKPAPIVTRCWDAKTAEGMFLKRFVELSGR
jgi:hypothetical protein